MLDKHGVKANSSGPHRPRGRCVADEAYGPREQIT